MFRYVFCAILALGIMLFPVQVKAATAITILWTAPMDFPDSVKCSGYSLRVASTIDSLNTKWASCRIVAGVPLPSNPGLTDSVKTTQLAGDTLYYAIKACDKKPNWSAISAILPIYIDDNQPPSACGNLRFFLR